MEEIEIRSVSPLQESIYIRPMQVTFTQKAGKEIKWHYIKVHDSVAVLIYNATSKCLVLVKQFRPAVYMHECHRLHELSKEDAKATERTILDVTKEVCPSKGIMYELCAGLADKDGKSMEELASMEVLEETGYQVPPEKFELISKYRAGVGTTGSLQTLFYVEVTNDMRVHEGGGLEHEGEMIETVDLPIQEIQKFIDNHDNANRPSGFLFAFMWFLANKRHHFQ